MIYVTYLALMLETKSLQSFKSLGLFSFSPVAFFIILDFQTFQLFCLSLFSLLSFFCHFSHSSTFSFFHLSSLYSFFSRSSPLSAQTLPLFLFHMFFRLAPRMDPIFPTCNQHPDVDCTLLHLSCLRKYSGEHFFLTWPSLAEPRSSNWQWGGGGEGEGEKPRNSFQTSKRYAQVSGQLGGSQKGYSGGLPEGQPQALYPGADH